MASILRLGSRQIFSQLLQNEKSGMLSLVRPVTLQSHPAPPIKDLGHDERNMKLNRPMSPHLTIYSPQLTSMLSITHRATGMALAGYSFLLAGAAIGLPESVGAYLDAMNGNIGGGTLFLTKISLAFPLAFHFWNGIRHLLWDLGMFLTIKEVYLTGGIMLSLSAVTTLALTAM